MPFLRIILGLLTLASVFLFVNCMAACLDDNWNVSIFLVNILLSTLILCLIRFSKKGLIIDAYLWICVVLEVSILFATVAIYLFSGLDGVTRL